MAKIDRKPYLDNLAIANRGKTRDLFHVPGDGKLMLIVATDAVSTHNVPHKSLIKDKGYVQNALNVYWATGPLKNIKTHLVAYGKKIYEHLSTDRSYPDDLHYRAVVVQYYKIIPYEFIWRAYMAGSLYDKFYSQGKQNPYGVDLPEDLQLMSEFPKPIFTPTNKSDDDDPVLSSDIVLAYKKAVDLSEKVYSIGRKRAKKVGMDIIDFKAEIAYDKEGNPVLIDEWLNGDCTRIVNASDIELGKMPPWRDKETIRQAAKELWAGGDKVPLEFSQKVLNKATVDYRGVFYEFTGMELEDFQKKALD